MVELVDTQDLKSCGHNSPYRFNSGLRHFYFLRGFMFRYEEEEEKEDRKTQEMSEFAFKKMLKSRSILLTGEVNKNLSESVIRSLLIFQDDDDKKPIKIFIDSPGGDLYAGFSIFDMIRFVKCPVYTIGMGLVASAASLILLSSPKERRVALPNSSYLLHQPLISGVIRGVSSDIEIHAKEIEKSREKLNQIISIETGVSIEEVKKHTDRDYWLSSEEALEYKLISGIVKNQNDLDKIIG